MFSFLRKFSGTASDASTWLKNRGDLSRLWSAVGSKVPLVCEGQERMSLSSSLVVEAGAVPVRFRTGRAGRLVVEDDVVIGPGSVLSAESLVAVGKGACIGPQVFVVDSNIGDPDAPDDAASPILIGEGSFIGSRATLLKGARIGPGARVMAGSLVASAVAPGSVVEGNPARLVARTEPVSAHEPLFRRAWVHPERAAIITSGEATSYGSLWQRVTDIARALGGASEKGSHHGAVLCWSTSPVDFIACVYAAWLMGKVAVPVPDGAATATVREMWEASNATALLAEEKLLARLDDSSRFRAIALEEVPSHVDVLPFSTTLKDRSLDDPASIAFTSGTTAKKKAVLLTHGNLLSASRNIQQFTGLTADVREFVSVPLYHSFGLGRVRAVLSMGGTLVLEPGPLNPGSMIAAIERHGVDSLSAVPAGLALFRGRLEPLLARIGARVRFVELGSAFLSKESKARLCELFPKARLCMHYGLTEASRSTFLEFHTEQGKLESVGKASPNVELSVVGEDGSPQPPMVEGEVVISGRHVFREYLGDPARTGLTRLSNGAFKTGDYGYLDNEGYLYLLGRKDEIINKGGIKISPEELENALRPLFSGSDFCVLGVPDPDGIAGQIPVVAHTGPQLSLSELLTRAAGSVDKGKLPDRIVQVESIFRTENGKPQRQLLLDHILKNDLLRVS